jgi:hypothetical protein
MTGRPTSIMSTTDRTTHICEKPFGIFFVSREAPSAHICIPLGTKLEHTGIQSNYTLERYRDRRSSYSKIDIE